MKKILIIFVIIITLQLFGGSRVVGCVFTQPVKTSHIEPLCGDFYSMKNNEIIWKPIIGYEGLYEVNNLGEVMNLSPKTKLYSKHNSVTVEKHLVSQNYVKGYLKVSLSIKGTCRQFSAHRLCGEAFISNPENKPCINHKNGIKDDNRIENLEWATQSENTLHASRVLKSMPQKKGGLNKDAKQVFEYSKDGELIYIWDSVSEVDNGKSAISAVCRGEVKSYYGKIYSFNLLPKEYFSELKIGRGEPNSIPVIRVNNVGEIDKKYKSMKSVKSDGFDADRVSKCCKGIVPMHKGFYWHYASVDITFTRTALT